MRVRLGQTANLIHYLFVLVFVHKTILEWLGVPDWMYDYITVIKSAIRDTADTCLLLHLCNATNSPKS